MRHLSALTIIVLSALVGACTTVPVSPILSSELRPAMFVDAPGSMLSRLKFPRGDEDLDIGLRCVAVVGLHGEMLNVRCGEGSEEAWPFRVMLSQAWSGARMAPAIYDGKPVEVTVPFRIRFTRRDGVENIKVFPNHGWNLDLLGDDYVSAQRVYRRFEERPVVPTANVCRARDRHTLIASIASDGSILGVTALDGTSSEACVEQTAALVYAYTMIPAHVNGKPVGSIYRQRQYDWRESRPALREPPVRQRPMPRYQQPVTSF